MLLEVGMRIADDNHEDCFAHPITIMALQGHIVRRMENLLAASS